MTKTFKTVAAKATKAPKAVAVSTIPLPTIGQGACYNVGSDRYPATVIAVTAKSVTIQDADAKPGADFNYFGNQNYVFTPDPTGKIQVARWSAKRNRFTLAGGYSSVSFTGYGKYSDPSF